MEGNQFFVIISTSRASLPIPVALAEHRVDTVLLSDPTEEVIISYLEKSLSILFSDSEEEERNVFIHDYICPENRNTIFRCR